VAKRWERGRAAPLTWDPIDGGKKSRLVYRDREVVDLGRDPAKVLFNEIANRMMSGNYYPVEVIKFHGAFRDENRSLQPGDRVLQQAPLIPKVSWMSAWSTVEIFLAERGENVCRYGYVTTADHHGQGIWQSELIWEEGSVRLVVTGISSPRSLLFWCFLPVARHYQVRAWRQAEKHFHRLARNLTT